MAESRPKAPATKPAAAEAKAPTTAVVETGFRGVEVDKTPNHAYTVAGVLAGEPVPEAAADPAAARREASGG